MLEGLAAEGSETAFAAFDAAVQATDPRCAGSTAVVSGVLAVQTFPGVVALTAQAWNRTRAWLAVDGADGDASWLALPGGSRRLTAAAGTDRHVIVTGFHHEDGWLPFVAVLRRSGTNWLPQPEALAPVAAAAADLGAHLASLYESPADLVLTELLLEGPAAAGTPGRGKPVPVRLLEGPTLLLGEPPDPRRFVWDGRQFLPAP